jgi:DNA mismatch repair protein MutS2
MEQETLKTLEYFSILRDLENLCITKGAKEYSINLKPLSSFEDAFNALRETTESKLFYQEEGDLPFLEFIDIEPILEKVKVLSIVSGEELLRIATAISTLGEIKEIGEAYKNNFTLINSYTTRLSKLSDVSAKINKAIGPDGKLLDDASPLLSIIRREIKVTYIRIQNILQKYIYSKEYDDIIQDQIITKRNGRYVIPIRQNSRPVFQYVVQGESSSRLTLFVEPIAVVELNNKLVDLTSKEKQEEEKIILELESYIRDRFDQIISSLEIIYKLDFMFAKAKHSLKIKGEEPRLTEKHSFNLFNARHPFITEDMVVPIDVSAGEGFRMLIITGPNTGGKTVTLKTIGLLILMAQSGLHIPAYSNSEIGFFEKIYADIGDEQSIQQNLSTFSSHMERIIKIINNADEHTLALIDELGAGTDPEEGSSLGYAILIKLYNLNAISVITTHHSKLKEFPYNYQLAKNSSVGFDIDTLAPTYKLYLGIPGKSHAFIIAEKLGLPPEILEDAKKEISEDYSRTQTIISKMSEDQKRIGDSAMEIERNRKEIESLKNSYENRVKEIEDRRRSEINKAYEESRRIVAETQKKMNSIIDNLENYIKSQKELQEIKKEFEKEKIETESKIEAMTPKEQVAMDELEEGSLVYVPNFKRQGIILSKIGEKGKLVIQMGSIRATVSIDDVQLLKGEAPIEKEGQEEEEKDESLKELSNIQVPMKLDLHGYTVEEAIEKIDKYLDSAYLVGLPFVYIVHGKGLGTLKESIIDHLRGRPHISHFYTGTPEEGGTGVTIVYLK